MATQIVWDDVDTEPQPPEPQPKLVGGGLDFAPTEDLIAELGRRGIVVGPVAPYSYPPSGLSTSGYCIATTSATTQPAYGGMQNAVLNGTYQLLGALGGTHK